MKKPSLRKGQENIPHLLSELIPQSTFCTQVVNQGILGHYVATASLATGVYETFDNFANVAPSHPTVFEYYRKALGRPANDTWVIAPSNGFNCIGQSNGSQICARIWGTSDFAQALAGSSFGSAASKSGAISIFYYRIATRIPYSRRR